MNNIEKKNNKVFNIKDFGAVEDGKTVNTIAIQKTIDECSLNGGGQVLIPQGDYLCGGLTLCSNMELHLMEGASLIASISHDDFIQLPIAKKRSFTDKGGFYAFLYAEEESNITISGLGTIDGQGTKQVARISNPKRLDQDGRLRNILLISCKKLLVKDLSINNSSCWNQHYLDCEDLKIENIKVFNHGNHNNDGLDIDSCRRVIVKDCFIDSDDDAFCLKSTTNDYCEDIEIYNCIAASKCNAIKIGTDAIGGYRNINIHDCKVITSTDKNIGAFGSPFCGWAAINICPMDGGLVENISITNIDIDGPYVALFIRIGERCQTVRLNDKPKAVQQIKNLNIKGIRGKVSSNWGCALLGSSKAYMENVLIEDVDLELPGGCKEIGDEVPMGIDFYPQPDRWKTLPAYGFFVRYAKNIEFRNIILKNKEDDSRKAFIAELSDNVKYVDRL